MTKSKIFALAAFTYLFLAPFTFHPDIKTIFYQSQFLSKGVLNIYSFFATHPEKAFLGNFVYPPLAYFIFGVLFIPVKLIAGSGFIEWLSLGNDAVAVPHIFQYLFAIKLPIIFLHFLTGFLLLKFFEKEKDQKLAMLLWFFNPISLYTIAFMGQIDGVAVLLTVLALILARRKSAYSLIFLGLAAAIKTYPILLLPFLVLFTGDSLRKKLTHFAFGIASYGIFILPFAFTPAFYSSTLVSGLSQRLFELKLYIGFGESLLLVPGLILLLFLIALSKRIDKENILSNYFLAITLIMVSLTHFHPQWGLWFLPFLIISFVKTNSRSRDAWFALILMFIGFLGTVVFFDDTFLSWGILSPIDPGILFLPNLAQGLRKFIDPLLIQSFFHTIFMSGGIYVLWKISKRGQE